MGTIYPAALSHFAVFCPALGPDEDSTHEQLLFYAAAALPAFYPCSPNDYFARNMHLRRRSSGGTHETAQAGHHHRMKAGRSPSSNRSSAAATGSHKSSVKTEDTAVRERVVSLDTKLREIGLGAALIAFAGSFGGPQSEDPRARRQRRFHSVHTEKRRTLIYEPEPGVLVQLAVVLPRRVRPFGKEKDAYSIEFLDSELSDQALRAWLAQEYCAFVLLFGPVGRVLEAGASMGERQLVKRQLDAFFGRTMWQWDQRWDSKHGSELDLLHALRPLPVLPVGPISLGGFDEFWHDLSSLRLGDDNGCDGSDPSNERPSQPLAHSAAVLWRGRELVWSSWTADSGDDCGDYDGDARMQLLRALVSWSRAVYGPAFDVAAAEQRPEARIPHRQYPVAPQPPSPLSPASIGGSTGRQASGDAGGWSLPGSNWLWGWGGGSAQPGPRQLPAAVPESPDDGSESGASTHGESSAIAGGGLAQALSRAVNALVEPRAPTPPEIDPVFASEDYAITAADLEHAQTAGGTMLARDTDAESLRSAGSLASVRTAQTTATASVALSRQLGRASLGRNRSSTMQHGNAVLGALAAVPGRQQSGRMRRVPGRAPSVGTNASAATFESTQLRDDTRVSSRSWWPASWTWGGSNSNVRPRAQDAFSDADSLVADHHGAAVESLFDDQPASGIDPASTFLFTGEYPFPGLAAADGEPRPRAADHICVAGNSEDDHDGSTAREETAGRLGAAMDEEMPEAYRHGEGVDCSRGVVLAPRAVAGMLYDTRLVRLLFDSAINAGERALFVELGGGCATDSCSSRCSRTLAYKFGDLLFLVFGPTPSARPPAKSAKARGKEPEHAPARRNQRRQRRRNGAQPHVDAERVPRQPDAQPFAAGEAQAIEAAVLRYAQSLQLATQRDAAETAAQIQHETQLAQQQRLPPYVYQPRTQLALSATRTSWAQYREQIPSIRSFAGYVRTSADPLQARHAGRSRRRGGVLDTCLPANVQRALDAVRAELAGGEETATVCVRMQDKGWVAAELTTHAHCFCVVDQPKATLADAQSFLTRISLRAASMQSNT
ncbi:hypothetical protein H4S02_004430 [Coemansia sp. RSA 2611]|nr:hypothetical protein H4S02_004430 [Coemansia sp. RSA 2611]